MRMRHIVVYGLPPLCKVFPHYLINGSIFGKTLQKTKCLFWFSLQLLSETFLILSRNKRDMIPNVYRFSCRVPLLLSDILILILLISEILLKMYIGLHWKYRYYCQILLIFILLISEILLKMYIGLHVKYRLFFSDFNETWIFVTDFQKLLGYKISWKSVQWEPSWPMRARGQADRHDEVNSRFSQFWERP